MGRPFWASYAPTPPPAGIPIIFATARVLQQDQAQYRALGAIAILPKPFNPLTLAKDLRAMVAAVGT